MSSAKEKDRRLLALLGIMTALGESASINEVLFAASKEVVAATGAASCNSFLMRDDDGHLYYRIVGPVFPANWTVPNPPDALAVEVLRTGKPITVSDCANDPRCDAPSQKRFGIRSALVFPLLHEGNALAAACCIFKKPHTFTKDEIAVIMAIAGVAAMAVAHSHIDAKNLRLAVAEERNRLSQELHDSLCQSLAITRMQLNLLLMDPNLPEIAKQYAQEAIRLVNDAYNDARDIVHSFRATGTVGEDFPHMFEAYVHDFSARTGIKAIWSVSANHLAELSPDIILQLSRVMGEALSNVRKHARARSVTLSSAISDDAVTIAIEDDGVGLNLDDALGEPEGHFGLKVMSERASLAGGKLSIESCPLRGTRIVLSVPRGIR